MTVTDRVTTRSKAVGMISFVREKLVLNTVMIVKSVCEEIVVHVSSRLRRRGIVGGIQTKPNSKSETLLIGRIAW